MNTKKAWEIATELAKTDKPWAKKASELLEACCEVVESTDGVDLGIGLVRDSEEICGQIVDGFLNDLMPAIVKAVDGDWRTFDFYFGVEDEPSEEADDLATKEPPASPGDGEADADDEDEDDIDRFR